MAIPLLQDLGWMVYKKKKGFCFADSSAKEYGTNYFQILNQEYAL